MLKRLLMGCAATALIVTLGATAYAADCGTECDTTLRQGQVFQAGNSVVIYGSGGAKLTRVWIPLLLDDRGDSSTLLNNSVVRIVNGRILGGTTTFSAMPYTVILFGTADVYDDAGTYTSNDIVVWEGTSYSDTIGQLLGNGSLVWRANYAGAAQNNLEWSLCHAGQQTPIPEPATGIKLLQGPGIDNGTDNAYLGTPSAIEHGTNFYLGETAFGPSGLTIPTGCDIYDYNPAGPPMAAQNPTYMYSQAAAEAFATANGIQITTYGSQTEPVFAKVNNVYYVVFGINESTSGGSARPAMFAIDAFAVSDPNDPFDNAVAIMAPAGFRFVDHKATGGGSNVYENAHFEMNSSGQIVALTERITGWPPDPNNLDVPTYQILLYNPVFTGGQITGYSLPTIIADAGPLDAVPQDGLVGPYYVGDPGDPNDPNNPFQWISALSGVGINDRGNIAFVGLYDTGEPLDPNDPTGPTRWDDAAYLYQASTATLHQVLRENDVIDRNPGNPGAPRLAIGPIPREDSDAFMGASLADDADVLAVNFRSNRDSLDGLSRGVAVVAVGHVGDVDFNGTVGLADLGALLAGYNSTFGTRRYNSQADFDLDGDIDLSDLATLLSKYGQPR